MAGYDQTRFSCAGSLLEDVMTVWESYTIDDNNSKHHGAPFDAHGTDEGSKSPVPHSTSSASPNKVPFSRKGINFSRKLNVSVGLDSSEDTTNTQLYSSQERLSSSQALKNDSECLQEHMNEIHSVKLTRQASDRKQSPQSRLCGAIDRFKGNIQQIRHSFRKTEVGHHVKKASDDVPCDCRTANPDTNARFAGLSYETNTTQDPIPGNGNDAERWHLRGGAGTLFSLAALRDKYRNGHKPQVKLPAPELGSSEPVGQTRQSNDAFTGLWNGDYRAALKVPNEVPLDTLHWWLSGGRLGGNLKPQTVGDLREMRKASDKVKNRVGDKPSGNRSSKPRSFWNEFGYALTGGRYGSGRDWGGSIQIEDQTEEASQPSCLRAVSDPSASRLSRSIPRSSDGASQPGACEAADRTRSRSRVSTWTESSGSHMAANPPSR